MKRVFWDVLVDTNTYRVFKKLLSTEESLEWMNTLEKGNPMGKSWIPLKLQFWEGDRGYKRAEKKKPVADFTETLAMPLVNLRGREKIEPLIATQVEFLPFETPVGPYYGLHVKYVDCLDVDRAKVVRFKSSGRIMEVEKYAFHWERLEGIHIFHLPELVHSRLFVSDEFKRVVEENGLTGLLFYPVPLVEDGE
ncbi:MAG: imm11 family protein [Candidatus Thermochlorobacter sp.]